MTQEQKAKAYDKAKYIMKEYIESGNAGVIAENTIKKAFPELNESKNKKDERIIKALIQLVTNYPSMDLFLEYDIHSYEIEEWLYEKLANREKGEQKNMK